MPQPETRQVLGRRAIIDVPTASIALGTLGVLVYTKRVPEPLVIILAGVIGLTLKLTMR